MRLKKIKVYGKLRQFLGKSYFEAAVRSPQQAMSFLMANFEGLQKHMNDQIYKIKMGGNDITEDYLSMSGQGDIQIIPVAIGSGWFDWIGDVFDFVVDVATDVVNFVADNALTIGLTVLTGGIGGLFTQLGTSLLLGGINQLLSPSKGP